MGNYAYKSSAFCHVEQEKTRDFRKGKQKDEDAEGQSVVPWGASGGGWLWSVDEDGALARVGAERAVGCARCRSRSGGVRRVNDKERTKNAPFDRGMVEGRVWGRRNAECVVRAEAGIIACLWRF